MQRKQSKMKQQTIYCLITLLGWSDAKNSRHSLRNTVSHKSTNTFTRHLQSTIDGVCKSSTMSPGDLIKANESILCYPLNSPIYKFGVDSSNTLAYYVYDTLVWRAVPTVEESTACIVFGNCDSPSMTFFRLQNGGSLAGYDADTTKIWDSHENIEVNGEYYLDEGVFGGDGTTDATGDKASGSTLFMNEDGVFIESPADEVTWRIVAPAWEAPTSSPVNAPSVSPVAETAEPTPSPVTSTSNPTKKPTPSPVAEVVSNFVGVSGRVFEDETESSSIASNIVVDLYECPDSGDPTWIVMTRTNETGHYVLKDDGSSSVEDDLSDLLSSMNITKFRAMFGGLQSGYTFSPAVSGSDVNSDGMTACWDLDSNGRGSIVWNAGVIAIDESTDTPVSQPTTSRPTTTPPSSQSSSTTSASEPTASIGLVGGYAFLDINDDGMRGTDTSTEPFMTNIDVQLFSCGSTAANFADDTKLAVDTTNAEGMFIFRNLTSGYYRIVADAPEGYAFSSVWSGNQENGELTHSDADSTIDPDTGSTPCFRVIQGNTDLSWGFGLVSDGSSSPTETPGTPSPASVESTPAPVVATDTDANTTIVISGLVFFDKDENGYYDDTDEVTISLVDVALFDCDGAIIFVTSTDESGLYGFEKLALGSYQVKFSPPTGYEFSKVWSGAVDEEGNYTSRDANSDVDPETGLSTCREYNSSVYSLNAGMILSADGAIPTDKPTADPKGDGSPCSGGKCSDGMCRNVAGICGSGLSFCNPQSVWTSECEEGVSKVPTLMPITVTPTISNQPTLSSAPSEKPSIHIASVCNNDGSYGETTANSKEGDKGVKEQGVSFKYSLLNESGQSFEDAVAQFEEALAARLACVYFEDSCLRCSADRQLFQSRRLVVDGSDVVGLSSKPTDEQNLLESCASPNYNCRVMTALMTSYFPQDTPLSKVISDTNQMLDIIADEMATGDWNGVTVSYNNEPIEASGAKEVEGEGDDGGFPAGAIVGIVLAGIAAFAALAALIVFFIKDRREKEQQRTQARIIPFGDDSRGSQSFSDDSDSDSSSEDDMSGVISGPSAVSGGEYSYPTTMARANPSDVEQDDSSSSDSSSSDDEESGEYDIDDHGASVENLKTSASSDEAPPVYEQDDIGDYSQDHDQYRDQIADDQNDFDTQGQYHEDQMHYGQMRGGDDRSNGSGGSMGSMNSADPPGRSFRDLHQGNDWSTMPPPQPIALNNVIEGDFYVDENPNNVYEHDDVSNPDSHYSNASHRSSRSNRSNRSNRSKSRESRERAKSRERSKSRDRNQASYHSFYNDDDYIGDVDQGSNSSRGRRTDNDYMDYEQPMQQDNTFGYNDHYQNPQHDIGVVPPQYKENYEEHYEQGEYQEQDYTHYQDDTTTFSDTTRQMSNVHEAPMHEMEQLSEANSEPSYEEDEESISNIFKSLSEIQTKLAKKGKTSSKGMKKKISTAHSADGIVEDVSVDGSQVSSFDARAAKNRRPSAGNWMEPVGEDET